MNRKSYDVIMVGGGLMSCATAYYLLKAEKKLKVAIIEMDSTYAHSSTTLSDGNIRIQFNIKENIQISQYGLECLINFAEEMSVDQQKPDIAFRQQGNLFLVDEDSQVSAKNGLTLQQSLGCEVEWMTPDAIMQRYPTLKLDNCVGGTFGRQDGTMDPHAVLQAYKNKAIAMGAEYLEAEVANLRINEEHISGIILTSGEPIATNCVVNGAGAWATQIAQTADVNLPINPVKRQVFVVETNAFLESLMPLTVFPSGLYLIHENSNHFMVGKSLDNDPVGFEFNWNRETFNDYLWPELVDYIPSFDRLKILRGWAGLYAVNTMDGNAILGEWPTLKGLFLANGFSGHGFQQCHAVGRYLSELILGLQPKLDLSIFSPRRVIENKPVFENQNKLI